MGKNLPWLKFIANFVTKLHAILEVVLRLVSSLHLTLQMCWHVIPQTRNLLLELITLVAAVVVLVLNRTAESLIHFISQVRVAWANCWKYNSFCSCLMYSLVPIGVFAAFLALIGGPLASQAANLLYIVGSILLGFLSVSCVVYFPCYWVNTNVLFIVHSFGVVRSY